MHAVVVRVRIDAEDGAITGLREQVVPQVSKAPGFVTGYWTRKDNTGLSMIIFESEEAAEGVRDRIQSVAPEGVTIEDIEVREVAAHA